MKVEQLMSAEIRACRADDALNDAAWTMWERDCGCVPVVDDDDQVIGMVTDRDIAMSALMQGLPLSRIRVATAMSTDVATVRGDQPLAEAEALMRQRQVRRLPVADGAGRLVGMLSLNDIVQAGAKRTGQGPPEVRRNHQDPSRHRRTPIVEWSTSDRS